MDIPFLDHLWSVRVSPINVWLIVLMLLIVIYVV